MNFLRSLSVSAVAVVTVAVAGCEATPIPDTPETAPATEETATATEETRREWTMPDMVGIVLQDAQDRIQALTDGGVLITASHDLSGQDRNQVLDANWQVCSQNIPPGEPITNLSRIDFGAVKIDENCP